MERHTQQRAPSTPPFGEDSGVHFPRAFLLLWACQRLDARLLPCIHLLLLPLPCLLCAHLSCVVRSFVWRRCYIDGPRYGRRVRSHTCFSGLAAADAFSPVLVLLPEGRLRKTQTAVSDTQEGQQRQHGCHQSKHCNQQPDEVCPNSPVIKIALEQKREFSHDVIFRESEGVDVDVL